MTLELNLTRKKLLSFAMKAKTQQTSAIVKRTTICSFQLKQIANLLHAKVKLGSVWTKGKASRFVSIVVTRVGLQQGIQTRAVVRIDTWRSPAIFCKVQNV